MNAEGGAYHGHRDPANCLKAMDVTIHLTRWVSGVGSAIRAYCSVTPGCIEVANL